MNGRLLLCCKCYAVAIERAESMTTDSKCESILSLIKKYGKKLDDLGKWYMKKAESLLQIGNFQNIIPIKCFDYFLILQFSEKIFIGQFQFVKPPLVVLWMLSRQECCSLRF